MALQRQPVSLNFAQGIDTKTDPYQVQFGKFLTLVNSVFTTTGRLSKRNGFQNTTNLPNNLQTNLTTLNDNLIATGSELYAFNEDSNQWLDQGIVQPVQLGVLPLLRASTSQTSPDTAIEPNGLACLVYMDNGQAYYKISDSRTGQDIRPRTALPATAVFPRAFVLGGYFIIMFIDTVVATTTLQYIAIPISTPSNPPPAPGTISANVNSLSAGYDGFVANNRLFLAWAGAGTTLNVAYLTQSLVVSTTTVLTTTNTPTLVSVTADITDNTIWVSWNDQPLIIRVQHLNYSLVPLFVTPRAAGSTGTPGDVVEIASAATNGVLTVFGQALNYYTYDDSIGDTIRTDLIFGYAITSAGAVSPLGSTGTVLRSVGLASKAFLGTNNNVYVLAVYGCKTQVNPLDNSNQSTYFLITSTGANSSAIGAPPSHTGAVYMRLAYANGGGYAATQVLPSVTLISGDYCVPYLLTDFLTTVNKATNAVPNGLPSNAIYTQTGINLAKFSLNNSGQYSSELAGALHLTGGQLWEYDGVKPVEHGFQLWPENVVGTWNTTGGTIVAQPPGWVTGIPSYYAVFTYEWTDNAGMLHRSAPSIPIGIVTTGSASISSITWEVPTLRLTFKQPFIPNFDEFTPSPSNTNSVRIVGYRWSVAQQIYYQFTSITRPYLNDTTVDSIEIVDTLSDAQILGNTPLYTNGGVIENIAAPASIASTLFNNRLFLIDAEDRNLLWFSKQVIEAVPVEMSDLLTIYVAPTIGAQYSTGPMTALGAMDDKLIIFKKDAAYYINGNGPDNTGANSTFSDPIFITSSVGCNNPSSVVLQPNGLMFQSDKGIWLLGRDLSTTYIGAPVEAFNVNIIKSATNIPGTTQVRFVLDNNVTLMYDYFFNQWGTHTNIAAISATLYQGAHTYLNSLGQIYQETPGVYLDGSVPVLMSLTTSWINVAGLQGYERFYFMFLLGTYLSPFQLNVQLAYDYNSSPSQATIVTPDNQTPNWSDEAAWGTGGPWGGPGNVFQARIFPQKQKCESFQVTINELYDPSFGQSPGQGLSLSGINLIAGIKKGYRVQKAGRSFG